MMEEIKDAVTLEDTDEVVETEDVVEDTEVIEELTEANTSDVVVPENIEGTVSEIVSADVHDIEVL